MPFYYKESDKILISYKNRSDENFSINNEVETALNSLSFTKLDDGKYKNLEAQLKLIMCHGELPNPTRDEKFNKPTVILEMSSQGFTNAPECWTWRKTEDNQTCSDFKYFLQGGQNETTKRPTDSSQWVALISWLLSVDLSLNTPTSPDDPTISRYIIPSLWPEHLVAAYLLQCAKSSGKCSEIAQNDLPDDFWQKALEEFKEQTTKMKISDINHPDNLSCDKGMDEVGKLFARISEVKMA